MWGQQPHRIPRKPRDRGKNKLLEIFIRLATIYKRLISIPHLTQQFFFLFLKYVNHIHNPSPYSRNLNHWIYEPHLPIERNAKPLYGASS